MKSLKTGRFIYIALFLVICLVPSAGLVLGIGSGGAESSDTASLPSLKTEDGSFNVNILSDAGDWFEENFALRSTLVTANNHLMADTVKVSAEDGVVLGTDGWLYYSDSLDDYLGRNQLSDRALFDIAHTAKLTQDYCALLGINYLFAIVPNKNTVYPENMPYYDSHKVSEDSNRSRLRAFMEAEGVSYLDLTQTLTALKDGDEDGKSESSGLYYYHKRDSHWTNEGAAAGAAALLDKAVMDHRDYTSEAFEIRKDFEGDLEGMIYPEDVEPEEELYYDDGPAYSYVTDTESTFDIHIQTVSDAGSGSSLVMYRDSFGNAVLPFIAEAYDAAYFSRGTPYQLTDLITYGATDMICLRAERFLPQIAQEAPVLQSFAAEVSGELTAAAAEVTKEDEGYYTKISGTLAGEPAAGDLLYITFDDVVYYEAMPVHFEEGGEGFTVYLPTEQLDGTEPSVYTASQA